MADEKTRVAAINRRDFLRQGGAVGVGLGIGLDASRRASALGTPAFEGPSGADVVPVPNAAIRELRSQLGDDKKVLIPEDSAYLTTGLPANGRYRDIRPAAIAKCANAEDVVRCVRWCLRNGVSPVVRGGGHSYAGYSTTTGLLIDIGGLNSVEVKGDTAVVGGGALNADVFEKTKGGEYFLPVGTCLGVGVGGLVLGGGIGYNSRWAGLTSDSLLSTTIATAYGDLVEASPEKNKDLFWACRGGAGGSFGVNTSFKFKLTKAPKTVTYFRYVWHGADFAEKLFAAFNKLMADGESRLNAVAMAQAIEGPEIYVRSRGQYIGPKAELLELLSSYPSPQRTKEEPITEEKTFWEAAEIFTDPPPASSHSFGDISRYAKAPISDTAISKLVELLKKCPGRSNTAYGSMWSLGWVGGDKINSVARTDTAYVHRGMSTLLRPTCTWPDDAHSSVGNELLAWTKEMIAAIAPETPNESYQNFPNRLIEDWQQQYYAENLSRLIDVKTRYDPNNLFKNAQSIPPRGA